MSRTSRVLSFLLTGLGILFLPNSDVASVMQAKVSSLESPSDVPLGLQIDQAIDLCGYPSVSGDSVTISFSGVDSIIADVDIYWSSTYHSDVYDQYERPSPNSGGLVHEEYGSWVSPSPFSIENLQEGLYRVRAVITTTDGIVSEDYDHNGEFDDFTFDESNVNHALFRVDRSVTDFTLSSSATTIGPETGLTITVLPDKPCDIGNICCGLRPSNNVPVYDTCRTELTHVFNPVTAGLVTLTRGLWHGPLAVRASDPLGNSAIRIDESDLYVLSDEVMVVDPEWSAHLGGGTVKLHARKWSSSPISEVEFFYGDSIGPGTSIGTDARSEGDEFSILWDYEDVCYLYVWVSWKTGESRRVKLLPIICEGCTCPDQANTEPLWIIDSRDVSACVDVLYRGIEVPRSGFFCPAPRFDMDCDYVVSVIDLAILIDYVYLDGPGPCDPCTLNP
jgi:hypothetical protein